MITLWTKNLRDPEEIEGFEKSLRNSYDVLDRLKEILKEIDDDLVRSELSVKAYETPSWSHLQAHKNGYRECIRDIFRLVNLDNKEH